MTGMGNVVREVAFALGTYHQDEQAYLVPQARVVVQHLAEKGLLAPAPLREEWGVRWDDHDIWGDMYNSRHEAETGAGDEGTPVHRYVSDWEKA